MLAKFELNIHFHEDLPFTILLIPENLIVSPTKSYPNLKTVIFVSILFKNTTLPFVK